MARLTPAQKAAVTRRRHKEAVEARSAASVARFRDEFLAEGPSSATSEGPTPGPSETRSV